MTLVGDIDLDGMQAVVEKNFADFKRSKLPTIVLPKSPR